LGRHGKINQGAVEAFGPPQGGREIREETDAGAEGDRQAQRQAGGATLPESGRQHAGGGEIKDQDEQSSRREESAAKGSREESQGKEQEQGNQKDQAQTGPEIAGCRACSVASLLHFWGRLEAVRQNGCHW
jgi:hypothetical protein